MDALLQKFQHLQIQLKEITSATTNFDDKNLIGSGGFGKVYKGEVSHCEGRSIVAIKRLDRTHGQGEPEFLKEITMLSDYRHENLISLVGFCVEGHEMILVYEHASRGSLDRHLKSPHLTWTQRLKICLDAAKGLSYLHDPRETHQRLIHCDIKSANILLDDQWNAKVSDFGLSIMGPANENHSLVVTVAAGTHGYCDPQYARTHTLTKESDVYSFGVVLFEVLCGTLCYKYNGPVQQILVPKWKESYKQNTLNDIIFKSATIQPLDQSALETFSGIAYRCLTESREDRPKMAKVVTELETALGIQRLCVGEPHFDYEEMIKTAEPPLNYSSNGELWKLLSKGFLLNSGKTWFSLNNKGEHCEMISFAECLTSATNKYNSRWSKYYSRFSVGAYKYKYGKESPKINTRVKAKFLSPGITYTVNFVFKIYMSKEKELHEHIFLKYRLRGEKKPSVSNIAYMRDDGWWMCELYQFTSDQRTVDLEIMFEKFYYMHGSIAVEGIEFRPLEKCLHDHEKLDMQSISDSDANWEEKLPIDYEDVMKLSTNRVQWTTKKEAYSILRKGFLIQDDGSEWFSLDKNGKKCHMISAIGLGLRPDSKDYEARESAGEESEGVRYESEDEEYAGEKFEGEEYESEEYESEEYESDEDEDEEPEYSEPIPKTRYEEPRLFYKSSRSFTIIFDIEPQLVSFETTYAIYLVYKLPKDRSYFDAPMKVKDIGSGSGYSWLISLASPQTPVIRSNADQNTNNPVNTLKLKGVPQQRNDGWMEVQISEFRINATTKNITIGLEFINFIFQTFIWIVIEGIELRPI